jgi:hypothetical protein
MQSWSGFAPSFKHKIFDTLFFEFLTLYAKRYDSLSSAIFVPASGKGEEKVESGQLF